MPLFSVIIPTYNRKTLLKKAVNSVIEQTFPDWELIVIDDGSDDDTHKLFEEIKDPRVKYVHVTHGGVSHARNLAIAMASGEYICPLDSDDWWDKDKLKICAEYLQEFPEFKIFHTQEVWTRNGKTLPQKEKHRKPSGNIFPRCFEICCVSISTAVIHKTVFDEIGLFDETLPACEDYDFWLRVSLKYPVFLIDKELTLKDGGRPDQLSQKTEALDRYRIRAILKFLRSHPLTDEQEKTVSEILSQKAKVYLKGCIKRGKTEEIKYFESLISEV